MSEDCFDDASVFFDAEQGLLSKLFLPPAWAKYRSDTSNQRKSEENQTNANASWTAYKKKQSKIALKLEAMRLPIDLVQIERSYKLGCEGDEKGSIDHVRRQASMYSEQCNCIHQHLSLCFGNVIVANSDEASEILKTLAGTEPTRGVRKMNGLRTLVRALTLFGPPPYRGSSGPEVHANTPDCGGKESSDASEREANAVPWSSVYTARELCDVLNSALVPELSLRATTGCDIREAAERAPPFQQDRRLVPTNPAKEAPDSIKDTHEFKALQKAGIEVDVLKQMVGLHALVRHASDIFHDMSVLCACVQNDTDITGTTETLRKKVDEFVKKVESDIRETLQHQNSFHARKHMFADILFFCFCTFPSSMRAISIMPDPARKKFHEAIDLLKELTPTQLKEGSKLRENCFGNSSHNALMYLLTLSSIHAGKNMLFTCTQMQSFGVTLWPYATLHSSVADMYNTIKSCQMYTEPYVSTYWKTIKASGGASPLLMKSVSVLESSNRILKFARDVYIWMVQRAANLPAEAVKAISGSEHVVKLANFTNAAFHAAPLLYFVAPCISFLTRSEDKAGVPADSEPKQFEVTTRSISTPSVYRIEDSYTADQGWSGRKNRHDAAVRYAARSLHAEAPALGTVPNPDLTTDIEASAIAFVRQDCEEAHAFADSIHLAGQIVATSSPSAKTRFTPMVFTQEQRVMSEIEKLRDLVTTNQGHATAHESEREKNQLLLWNIEYFSESYHTNLSILARTSLAHDLTAATGQRAGISTSVVDLRDELLSLMTAPKLHLPVTTATQTSHQFPHTRMDVGGINRLGTPGAH